MTMLCESPETRPKHATQPKECVDHGRLGGTPLHNRAFADPGWTRQTIPEPGLRVYGADAPAIQEIAREEPALAEKLHPELPYIGAEVVWAVRAEMARTVEDVLARRTRALLLGARASIEAAPRVAELMARELRRDGDWQKQTVRNFQQVAQGYLPPA